MRVFLAAGGTGGHIFPAIAFGEWLKREQNISSVSSVYYICGSRPLELEIYHHYGIKPLILPTEGSPFGVTGLFKKIKRAFNIIKSCVRMFSLIRKYKPDACFMFGGYVSFPALIACSAARVPVAIHEQNAVPGRVVRLAQKMGKLTVKGWNNELTSGVPVRPFVLSDRQSAFEKLGIDGRWLNAGVIGIFGGSLAGRTLENALDSAAGSFPDNLFLMLSERGAKNDTTAPNILFIGRQWDMNPVFSVVDLVICRGGASTLAELEAYNIPSVVVPWEKAAGNHQAANAGIFSEITGNSVWRENQDVSLLISAISELLNARREKQPGFHDSASLDLYKAFEEKYAGRKSM